MEQKERIDPLTEEALEEMYVRELTKIMDVNKLAELPASLDVMEDYLPNLERWCADE